MKLRGRARTTVWYHRQGQGDDQTLEDGKERRNAARERLKGILDRETLDAPQATNHELDIHSYREHGVELAPRPSIREGLDDLLSKPRGKLGLEDDREVERDDEEEVTREADRDCGFSY